MNEIAPNIVELSEISKNFGAFQVLKKISFIIQKGLIFGIMGVNGAGKTTLIKILSGLLQPNTGRISIFGMNYENDAKRIYPRIGIQLDESFFYQELTIRENFFFFANIFGEFNKQKIENQIISLAELFNLKEWMDEKYQILSKGMKKKVELIRVLLHNPDLIILDEPFGGLDFKARNLLSKLFLDLKQQQKTIIFTGHEMDTAMNLCDELLIIKRGNIGKLFEKSQFEKILLQNAF